MRWTLKSWIITENGAPEQGTAKAWNERQGETTMKRKAPAQRETRITNKLPPIHPGETIREDVLVPLGMSVNQLAAALGVTAARLNEIVLGRRGITADTALRLSRYLGNSAEFWMGLQADYELRVAAEHSAEIEQSVRPRNAA